jgi:hypothetical protein
LTKRLRILLVLLAAPIALAVLGLLALAAYSRLTRPPDEWGWLEEYSVDQEYFTVKEAYQVVLPLIREWHADAVVTSASAGYLWSDGPSDQMQPDGRNGWWGFIACSNSAAKWVSVVVNHGAVGLGVTDKPWGTKDSNCSDPLPLESIIDSDTAMLIASCLANHLLPHHASIMAYDRFTRQPIPDSWMIDFARPQGGVLEVLIDGETGVPVRVVRDSDTLVPSEELPTCPS